MTSPGLISLRELALEAGSPKMTMRLSEALDKFFPGILDRHLIPDEDIPVALVCEYGSNIDKACHAFILAYNGVDVIDIDIARCEQVSGVYYYEPDTWDGETHLPYLKAYYRDARLIPGMFMMLMRVGVEEWMIDACLNQ